MKIVAMVLGILLLISLGFNIWLARRPVSEPSLPAPKKDIHSVSVQQPRVEIQKDAPVRKPKIDFNWDEELTRDTAPDIYTIWIHKGKGHNPGDYQFLVKVKEIIEGAAK